MAECRQPEEPFAAGAEAGTGGPDHVAFGKELVEEVPGAHAAGGLEPDVGGIHAAVAGDAGAIPGTVYLIPLISLLLPEQPLKQLLRPIESFLRQDNGLAFAARIEDIPFFKQSVHDFEIVPLPDAISVMECQAQKRQY